MTTDFARKIAYGISIAGIVGFLQPFWLGSFPSEFLNRIEFPNTLDAVRLTAPDGRVFIVSEPFGRVQRYGPKSFQRGFKIDSRGGVVDAGISSSGNLLICSVRARGLITYDRDGAEIGQRLPCAYDVANHGRIPQSPLYNSEARLPLIAINWFQLWPFHCGIRSLRG
jgi:hypothetical protein